MSGKTFELFNPSTEEKVADVSSADERDVDKAVECALAAFKTWKNTSAQEREKLLNKLADLLAEAQDELAYLDAVSMGKTVSFFGLELHLIAIAHIRRILHRMILANALDTAGLAATIRGVTNLNEGSMIHVSTICRWF